MESSEKKRKRPELLAPAGSLPVLKTAVIYGADAVYIGGDAFGLRAGAQNFSPGEMREGIAFAHAHGVKVYVTANILAHNRDLAEASEYFAQLRDLNPQPDALLISDPGLFLLVRQVWPEAEIHISTQANNTNSQTYLFWYQLGARRVVAARELSLEEIRQIREQIPEDMEIECFVHGAMCISYSGRCLLSNYFTGRDANQGSCTHPCRWKYAVMEETRPGEYLPVLENDRGTFLFNSRDLCMIEHIPELVEAGIDSFKIEGRMKNALYVAVTARTYRRALEDYFGSPEKYQENLAWYRQEIGKCTYRKFSTGFYFGRPGEESQIYDESTYVSEYTYLGIVEGVEALGACTKPEQPASSEQPVSSEQQASSEQPVSSEQQASFEQPANSEQSASSEQPVSSEKPDGVLCARIRQRNKFLAGDEIEIMKPDGTDLATKVLAIYDEEGNTMPSAPHAGQKLWLHLSHLPAPYDLLRVRNYTK